MTELWLVRHGQTDWNLEGRFQGQTDIPLNEEGISQARTLAAELNHEKQFDAVYSSDLKRAYRTAEIITQGKGLAIQVDTRLREVCQGEWEGMLFQDVVDSYRGEWDNRRTNPENTRPPGGESVAEVAARMMAAADQIACEYPRGRVLVVSHGMALAALLCKSREIPISQVYSHILKNAHPEIVIWPVAGIP